MAYATVSYPLGGQEFFSVLTEQLRLYTRDAPHALAALCNAAAVLKEAFRDTNWAGFYLSDGRRLVLGPFQGLPAVMEIPYDQGVCGAAFRKKRALAVADVERFEGHIACDCASRSELAVPVFSEAGEVLGIIDLDSPLPGRFSPEEARGLQAAAALLAPYMAALTGG